MKKGIVCILVMAAMQLAGLDLMLRNGQVFNNVTITGSSPYSVSIVANQNGISSNTIVTTVQLSELAPVSRNALAEYLAQGRAEMMGGNNGPLINTNATNIPLPQGVMTGVGSAMMSLAAPNADSSGEGMMSNSSSAPSTGSGTSQAAAGGGNYNAPYGQPFGSQADTATAVLSSLSAPGYAPLLSKLPPNAVDFNSDGMTGNPDDIQLPGFPHQITLDAITPIENGTLGWAYGGAPGANINAPRFGQIYLYGIWLPQGGNWFGNVYPTNKNIYYNGNYYPCYATSIAMARRINASYQY